MSTTPAVLSEEDIEKLFSGAPQFFARSEGHCTGAPHPSVAFPFDDELRIRDLTDHAQIEDPAWGCVTAWPHITRGGCEQYAEDGSLLTPTPAAEPPQRPHFYPRCRERPNMLSMQGLEKGTMGYQAALGVAVADALQEEQFGFKHLGRRATAVVEARHRIMAGPNDGLRRLQEPELFKKLIENETRYRTGRIDKGQAKDLYSSLFNDILYPPSRGDSQCLPVQIRHLIKVLAAPNVWIDFSQVVWRLRLGQILWGSLAEGDNGDGGVNNLGRHNEAVNERYWLLLQILLGCEMLIRLDAVTAGDELPVGSITASEIYRFERDANLSVKWTLILARCWLENIKVIQDGAASSSSSQQQQLPLPPPSLIQGRHSQRQINGLAHFVRKLRWPGADALVSRILRTHRASNERVPLPTTSRPSSLTQRGRRLETTLQPSGWMSRSYVSGLIMPGDGLGHLLMASLLENDPAALTALGPTANLYGGFVYAGKSFWSTACIVGRVLAAGKGATECMGWVSSDVVPDGVGDGWIDVKTDAIEGATAHTGRRARLWAKAQIERESHILGDAKEPSALPVDFVFPCDGIYSEPPPEMSVLLHALALQETTGSNPDGATAMTASPAVLVFRVTLSDDTATEYRFSLKRDVGFITAHPCVPGNRVRFVRPWSSPTMSHVDVPSNVAGGKATCRGHPLHKSYQYTEMHLSELLARYSMSSLEDLAQPSGSAVQNTKPAGSTSVLVVDCITGFSRSPRSPRSRSQPELSVSPSRHDTAPGDGETFPPEFPGSPILHRGAFFAHNWPSAGIIGAETASGRAQGAQDMMHLESRARQFGSDMEILVRALCAEKGWNAIVSRRRRGCLACAIREAGALGWNVIIRVD